VDDTEACIALNMIPGMGPVRLRRLLARFDSPSAVLRARGDDLQRVEGIGPEVARAIAEWENTVDLAGELHRIKGAGVRVLTLASPEYPAALRDIHDPPIALYISGRFAESDARAIGVVGTRKPSHYALDCAKKLSYQLSRAGLTVISGLARGIDTAAHQAALAANGRTVAVLGSGFGHLYPPENRELAGKIAESGAVISEFSMDVKPDRQTFPMRNRIISGCSFGVLVVEAGQNSGALISATQAAEQGRSLYVVPGRIDQPGAIGSNRLIQQGAKLVTGAADILDDFGMLFSETPELHKPAHKIALEGVEKTVFDALGDEEVHVDEVIAKCGLPSPIVSSTLLALEMRRMVKQLPGSRFVQTI